MDQTLDAYSIFLLLCVGGAIGGIAEYLRQIVYRNKELATNSDKLLLRPAVVLLFSSAIIGLSGALALQFILIWLNAFQDTNDAKTIVFLVSISVAAGFGARILLPEITERLRDQIKKLRAETDKSTTKAEEAAEKAEVAATEAKKAATITRAVAALTPETPIGDKKSTIKELMPIREKEPKNRVVVILIGRLYRRLKDYPTAISVLDNFLKLKEKDGEEDKDYADALYNKACYYALLYDDTKKEEYKNMALKSLARSIEISEENEDDAKSDPDFDNLRD